MKHLAGLFLPPFAVLGLASLPTACFSSSAGDTGDDAGVLPDDSGLVAPEDSTVPPVDAGSPEAGKDGPSVPVDASDASPAVDAPEAAPTTVTVTVLLGTVPEPGVLVVFQDATGAVVSSGTTDAAGTIAQTVVAGSQVTAALGTAQSPNLVTVQDVAPGDALTLVDYPLAPVDNSESVSVTTPAPIWDSGASIYLRAGGCGDPGGFPVYLQAVCISPAAGTYPLLATAADITGEIAYTYQTGNALSTDGGPLSLTITRPWSPSTVIETVAASGAPVAPSDAGITVESPTFDLVEVSGGVATSLSGTQAPDGGVLGEEFSVHPGFADFIQPDAYYSIDGAGELSVGYAVTRTAGVTTSGTTSLDLGVLPGFTGASVDTTDAGSPAQPVTSWTTTGSLASANGILTMVQWYAPPPDGGGSDIQGTWTIVVPPTATEARAPSMPASAAAFTPPPSTSYNSPRVVAVQAPFLPDYAAFKSQFATIPVFTPAGSWSPAVPLLPADGQTLYFSAIYPDEG